MAEYCMYLRKSRADLEAEQRGEGETLARHETALRAMAERLGLGVSAVYREIVSGDSIEDRPMMRRLLEEVERCRWDGVLVMEVERLARGDTVDQGVMARAFRYSETKIYTPLKVYDPRNEFDEEYFEFGLFMSRREYKAINRRLQRGRLLSAKEGKFTGSRPPFGYDKAHVPSGKGFTLAPNGQADIVRLIYRWFVHGDGGERLGTSAIAGKLRRLGVPSATGSQWRASTVADLLGNPVYMGMVRWNWRPVVRRMEDGKRVERRPRNADCDLTEGLHPPLVEPELWRQAQALLRRSGATRTAGDRACKNALAGLVVCGRCGKRMVRKPQPGGNHTLLCASPGCGTVSAPLRDVEEAALAGLAEWLGDFSIKPGREADSVAPELGSLREKGERELAELEMQRESLHDFLERGVYDEETFRRRMEAVSSRIEAQRERLRELEERRGADAEEHGVPDEIDFLELYRLAEEPDLRNRLLKEALGKVVYRRDRGGRWSGEPFSLELMPLLPPGRP